MIATYIQGEDTANLKCELVRYLNLACLLTYMQARDKHGRDPLFNLEELRQAGLINTNEHSILSSHQGAVP
eukprot:CAMPEP_0115331368 /NCGR_PEP_ID=MMETSP0270-20121206/86281_1 /TAXON_ID=71861 /ORGANISM="Scrippsiella trochoidea, Strain CCMP3099" /LENGTH=70 /DNA_ID=CAMNT_0002752161 /DNA_START=176 /DNA_END=385 /DNA_ORIENTATION=+